ncbi:MAG: carboxylate-amine ligase, partial [Chloroflexota bacterium]|nr:carboxylate-amine ligase [Chloroflexota bacterium]
MSGRSDEYTMGVEEEYQVVDPETRHLVRRADRVLAESQEALGEQVQPELQRSQLEAITPICRTLADVRAEIVRLRRTVIDAAMRDGNSIAAGGTHPLSHWEQQQITPKERYQGIAEQYGQLADEQVVFGCHVHVGLNDREAAVQVLNRARVWLSPLLALCASSPYWLRRDTTHASFRTVVWGRFPVSGIPGVFESRAEHDALIQSLVDTGSVDDPTKVYWDVRLPQKTPTIEFRVADVCTLVDEVVMLAGLVRGLVRTCHEAALREEPYPAARPEVLRAAHWRAARYGLAADLVDVHSMRPVPAHELVESLLSYMRPALEEHGEWEEVSSLAHETLRRGNSAARQRRAFQRSGQLEDVVAMLIEETARG